MTHPNNSPDNISQVPMEVMRELLTELRSSNEKGGEVVSLATSVQALETALNSLADKVDEINDTLFHNNDSGGIFTRIKLLEQRLDQSERGWQRWVPIFGSVCGALALVLAALIKAGL